MMKSMDGSVLLCRGLYHITILAASQSRSTGKWQGTLQELRRCWTNRSQSENMSLDSLLVKILESIVDETSPEGFESFVLTCRDVHAICKPFLQQHKELRALWDNF
jgi:hypothetical protein